MVKISPTMNENGQVYVYYGNDINNCFAFNMDPVGINFRIFQNGVEKKLWHIDAEKYSE